MHVIIKFAAVLCASSLAKGQVSFDASRHCPDYGPTARCHCSETVIECHTRGLRAIPKFRTVSWNFTRIDLENNSISAIGSRAFTNANVTEIILSSNNIAFIHDEAFDPIQNQLRVLDLRDNKLFVLPDVFTKLIGLNMLDVSYNPIPDFNFTDDVMRELGDYVHEFRFGDPTLEDWPQSIHHLQMLKILKFYGGYVNMTRIPIHAFSGFEWTLRKLWIQKTNLISVPIALQDLHSVNELHFDDNLFVKDAGILIPAFAGLTNTLVTMSLENNSLTTFPLVLRTLTTLHNLSLARNNLQFVSDEAVSVVGSNLTTLNLQSCNLDRIPGALSKLPGIINLDFTFNGITTIEKNDLQHMDHLQSLNVSDNPLAYVSTSTFYDLRSLTELIMKNTDLYLVPEAIKNIPSLRELHLERPDPYIECNCDLAWLYCYSKNHTLVIRGACYTIESTIQHYAEVTIPSVCPTRC